MLRYTLIKMFPEVVPQSPKYHHDRRTDDWSDSSGTFMISQRIQDNAFKQPLKFITVGF